MVNVLFICKGNVFRSMAAEKCMLYYIKQHNISNINVRSAGIGVKPQKPLKAVIQRLSFYVGHFEHTPKQIDKQLVRWADIIIAMGLNHKEYINQKFNTKTYLFNEVAYNLYKPVLDFEERLPDISLPVTDKEEKVRQYAYYTIDYICKAIPEIIRNLKKYTNKNI